MPLILGTNSIKDTGYNVANSCRFDDGSSDTMSRDNGTPTNLKKFSISLWFKRTEPGLNKYLITGFDNEDNRTLLQFSSDQLLFQNQTSGSNNTIIKSDAVFRDPSAWHHFCIIVDTTQSTSTNRVKMYVNGSQVTSLASSTYPNQNTDMELTDSANSILLNQKGDGSDFNSGYYAEVVVLDGTSASIGDFGEFDEDSPTIWKPKNVSGLTFGNNGFYLDFENSGNLGADVSGNSNNFTVNNLTSIDQSTDTCTNNFATFNPLIKAGYQPAFAEGNLKISQGTSGSANMAAVTIGVTSGKWYCEIKKAGGGTHIHGIHAATQTSGGDFPGRASLGWGINLADGNVSHNDSASTYGASVADGDILGIALDMDNNKLYFSKNGDWSNGSGAWGSSTFNAGTGAIDISAAAAEDMMFSVSVEGSSSNIHGNFGSPAEAISSGNADGDGFGNFEFAVPSGFFSLCTKNLAEYG